MRVALLVGMLLFQPLAMHAQARPEVIRGRVQSDSGRPVPATTVIATRAPDRAVFQTTSDSSGTYSIFIAEGTGDYLVYFSATGMKPFRQRITRSIDASLDSVFTLNATLTISAPQQLATIKVQATKPRPVRNQDAGTQTGASESLVDYFNLGAVAPDLAGDLYALAGTIPGVSSVDGGISVLGLGAAQNSTTLNGLAISSGTIPRAARTGLRVSTSTYDPSRGWFSGANTNVELNGGGVYRLRNASVSIDALPLQYTDELSSKLGQRFSDFDASVGASGPIGNRDRYFYNYAVEARHRTGDAVSLLTADADVATHAGIAPDSIARFLSIISRLGLPASPSGLSQSLTTDRISFLSRFDRNQKDARTLDPPKYASALTLFGSANRTSPVSVSPLNLPTRAAKQWNASAGMQALFSAYVGNDYLATLRSALSINDSHTSPYLAIPGAISNVSSELLDGDAAIASLGFGGASGGRSNKNLTWESTGELQLYTPGRGIHRVTMTTDLRLDTYVDNHNGDLGTYAFTSLAELDANHPAFFSRTLGVPAAHGGEWNGFVSIGDLWRISPTLRVQYGARVEGNAFTSHVPLNSLVQQTFGVRNDDRPNAWHMSPRFGFTWIRKNPGNMGALAVNKVGAFNMSPGYLRGGIGEFRLLQSPTLLSDAAVMTGLPGAARHLYCVGSSVPIPSWQSFIDGTGAAPNSCVGDASSSLADAAPVVRLVDPGFAPPRSWRGNLSWESRFHAFTYTIDGTYSLNLDQPETIDLNFRNSVAFITPDERRPVFVPSSAIIASSGVVPNSPARITRLLGPTLSSSSNLRSESRQLLLTLAPNFGDAENYAVSVSYALATTREQQSGFSGTTFDSPATRTWNRGQLDVRHQFWLRGGFAGHGLTLTAIGTLSSGIPFTPIVSSDVNGDGFANDRAFVGAVAGSSMQQLLSTSSASVRNCLTRQMNSAAATGSCEGPWTTSLNTQLSFNGAKFHTSKRIQAVHINFTNALGGLDQLLHGSGNLHGWGTRPFVDPVLYFVRGFDPSKQHFLYEVNPRFAASDPSRSLVRAPFRATIDFSINLTPDVAQQQLERYLGPGRAGRPGIRLTKTELVQRYSRSVFDPYQAILKEADSLLLSRGQVEALQQADARYRVQIDSLWLSLATDFSTLGDTYDVAVATKRQEDTIAAANELTRLHIKGTLGDVLTPIQLQLMPYARLYRSAAPVTDGGRTLSP